MKRPFALILTAGLLTSGCASAGPSPSLAAPVEAASPATRVFEIRTYTTHPGRLDALNRRFRDHTMRLFAKHGMTNIAYWVPQDSALAHNTLIYVISHPSRAAAAESWKAFGADPEWQRVRAASEADGPIVQAVESVFADATGYSPMQ